MASILAKIKLPDFVVQHKTAFKIGGMIIAGIIAIVVFIVLCIVFIIPLIDPPEEKKKTSKKVKTEQTPLPPSDPRYIPGYKFYQGAQINSGIIPRMVTGLPVDNSTIALKKECDALANCAGFDTFSKELLEDLPMPTMGYNPTATQTEGIYIKDSFKYELPIEVPGYDFLPGQLTNTSGNAFNRTQAFEGQPIGVVAQACTNNARCKSFNTRGDLQSEIYPLPIDYTTYTSNPTKGIYVKKEYANLVPVEIQRATQFKS